MKYCVANIRIPDKGFDERFPNAKGIAGQIVTCGNPAKYMDQQGRTYCKEHFKGPRGS